MVYMVRRRGSHFRQTGVAAVEFAIMLPMLVALLAAPLFIGRTLWHYTIAQKAAYSAAMYMSSIPETEVRSPTLSASSFAVARDIVLAEMSDIDPALAPYSVGIFCDGSQCDGLSTPAVVRVTVRVQMHDPFFGTSFPGDGLLLTGEANMSYIGSN